jgi:hypothetical protein
VFSSKHVIEQIIYTNNRAVDSIIEIKEEEKTDIYFDINILRASEH